MSGICAVWHKDRPDQLTATLSAVADALGATTGARPGLELVPGTGIGLAVCARLEGQQIVRSERILLACDADLLNEAELANAAGLPLERPRTAALLAALYERQGDRFVNELRGGFAVVLWDLVERRLFAAVDGFGIRRLAWYDDGRMLLVASRADVLGAGCDRLTINPRAIANVLNFSANLAPDTIFTRVERLMPGTTLAASGEGTRLGRYWDMRYGIADDRGEAQLSGALEAVIEQSVRAHAAGQADGRVGAFLSGGTDSSTIVGLMARSAGSPVKAFSIGFDEEGFSELAYAETAARAFGAEHHTYLVSASDCLEALPALVASFDGPFGNASAVATYFCARLAADHGVDVLLAGDGGDELFGGNEWYARDQIFQRYHALPRWVRTRLIEPGLRLPLDNLLFRRARGYVRRANMPGIERVLSFQFLQTHALGDVFEGDFLRSLDGYSVLNTPARHYDRAPARDHIDRLLYVDMKTTIGDNDLPKVTCAAGLAGVRPRFPFLDRSVAEFSGHIPARLKVKGLEKRYLFKQAFRNLLPAEIVKKKKHGFGVPVALWMKSDPRMRELAWDTLLSARARDRGYFRPAFIRDLLHRHETEEGTYHGDILWTFLMLELWHRQAVDEPAPVTA